MILIGSSVDLLPNTYLNKKKIRNLFLKKSLSMKQLTQKLISMISILIKNMKKHSVELWFQAPALKWLETSLTLCMVMTLVLQAIMLRFLDTNNNNHQFMMLPTKQLILLLELVTEQRILLTLQDRLLIKLVALNHQLTPILKTVLLTVPRDKSVMLESKDLQYQNQTISWLTQKTNHIWIEPTASFLKLSTKMLNQNKKKRTMLETSS